MAFDPRYRSNHLFYAAYTKARREPWRSTSSMRPRTPAANKYSRRRVIVVPHPGRRQPQRRTAPVRSRTAYLYISTGDGGGGDDQFDNARHLNVLNGKLLRIDPHKHGATPPYTAPPDNPYVGQAGRDEIFSYGLRNPWRFSFDSANGDLAIGDVGQSAWEEIDYVTRGRAKWLVLRLAHLGGPCGPRLEPPGSQPEPPAADLPDRGQEPRQRRLLRDHRRLRRPQPGSEPAERPLRLQRQLQRRHPQPHAEHGAARVATPTPASRSRARAPSASAPAAGCTSPPSATATSIRWSSTPDEGGRRRRRGPPRDSGDRRLGAASGTQPHQQPYARKAGIAKHRRSRLRVEC